MQVKSITLPYPVSANRYWRTARFGRTYVSTEAKRYKMLAGLIANRAGIKPTDKLVKLDISLYPKLPKDWEKRAKADARWYEKVRCIDVDNALKITIDALTGIAYFDDKQVRAVSIDRCAPVADGALVVRFMYL